jgi:hypothetical protein
VTEHKDWSVEHKQYLDSCRAAGKTRIIHIELTSHHFENCIWGDKDCNPISIAIQEALDSYAVCLRTSMNTLAPVGKDRIPLCPYLHQLFESWCDDTLQVGCKFTVEVPEDWFTK